MRGYNLYMMKNKIIYIDMDDVLCHFTKAKDRDLLSNPGVIYPQSQYGFYQNLEPIKDGIEAVEALIDSSKFDPYILTAPSVKNPLSYTEKRVWVEHYFGINFVERLIICSNKGLLKGDYLIDDHVDGRGQENFEGELIQFGSKQYPDWVSIREYLKF